jgi:hypothetical protein
MKYNFLKKLPTTKNIESFLYWSVSVLFIILGLILLFVYFQPNVGQHEVLLTIRYQLLIFTTAILCCPAVPIPSWFPFPSQYRFLVFSTSLVIMELMY